MILSRRFPIFSIGFAMIFSIGFAMIFSALLITIASGCRTSQQARRTAAERGNAGRGGASPASAQVDSLLMIQEKLIEVIDSMTTLVSADHSRIRVLEQQVRALESGMGSAFPPEPASDPEDEVTSPPPVSVTAPSNASDQYAAALRRFWAHDYSSALAAFQSLEVSDPNGALAGNYRYWQGECYFGEGEYGRALKIFESMQSEYPNSPKAPAAAYMRGQCYERSGDNASARAAYERVIADYPNSDFSDRARARLKALE